MRSSQQTAQQDLPVDNKAVVIVLDTPREIEGTVVRAAPQIRIA
jgi:hypothetical protein